MRITKYGHACVRLEHAGVSLVVDPGVFSDESHVAGADGILITHEHMDHYKPELIATSTAGIWTIEAVAAKIREDVPEAAERITVVAPGQVLDVAGVRVEVFGEKHAILHDDLPHFDNSGFLFDLGEKNFFHPGDSLELPQAKIDILGVPAGAPWMRSSEAVDFVRGVGAPLNLAIHDKIYTELGHTVLANQIKGLVPSEQSYVRIDEGTDLDV